MTKQSEWLEVGELADGFATDPNTLPYTEQLAGKTIDLHFENGWIIRHQFVDADRLQWQKSSDRNAAPVTEQYSATSLREGIYFVNFIKSQEQATSVSLVLNMNTGNATALVGTLPDREQTLRSAYQRVQNGDLLTGVSADFLQASIDRPFTNGAGHPVTDELLGKRVQYTYSPHEMYEHIYLNDNYYSWQCLKGVEKGLADTDLCHYYKIDEQLYLFAWREKIIPTLGVVMIDLQQRKTTGKIIGYQDAGFSQLNNFPVGAYARILNTTEHDLQG